MTSIKRNSAVLTGPPTIPAQEMPLNFNIVSHYQQLLKSDPSLTAPIAAIESLISILTASSPSTVSETLSLLSAASTALLKSQSNPIPPSAGTDLFQRYIVTSFQQTPLSSQSGSDFTHLRNQLIRNSKLFVSRTKQARKKIAEHALPFIQEDSCVIVYGNSRVVNEILLRAAETRAYFHTIFIPSSGSVSSAAKQVAKRLRSFNLPVATIPLAALTHTLCSLPKNIMTTMLFLGSEAVLENGSSISVIGSQLVAETAVTHELRVYVAVESYKFVRSFPLSGGDEDLQRMGTKQTTISFDASKDTDDLKTCFSDDAQLQDITPSHLISALITENGVMTPNAVAEELIKLWF